MALIAEAGSDPDLGQAPRCACQLIRHPLDAQPAHVFANAGAEMRVKLARQVRGTDPDVARYALGAAIARSFYSSSGDKADALAELLRSDDYSDILVRSGYPESRGTTRKDMEARLRGCATG